ncbi:MAG: hypothetical protein WC067_05135 [Candidatus Methanomethylophilaceae archaeon]
MDPNKISKNKTGKSAILFGLLVVVLVAIVVYIAYNPKILEDLAYLLIIIVIAIVIILVAVYLLMAILAVPMYAAKGESYQNDMSYDINDVKAVKETSSEDKKKEE